MSPAARRWRSASALAAAVCRCRCRSSAGPLPTRRYCGWRTPTSRRPSGGHGGQASTPTAGFSTELPPIPDPPPADIDAATRDRAASACRAAGLTLSGPAIRVVCAAAPYVEAMTGRLYRQRHWAEEPANILPVRRLRHFSDRKEAPFREPLPWRGGGTSFFEHHREERMREPAFVREVGMRDGLQASPKSCRPKQKLAWLDAEHAAGVRDIEVSFVCPAKAVAAARRRRGGRAPCAEFARG